MVRRASLFVCNSCGNEFVKWAGQCGACGEWNSLVETVVLTKSKCQTSRSKRSGGATKPWPLAEIAGDAASQGLGLRVSTRIGEVDRVLGGGLVSGQAVLLAGEPGIGKSTLMLQAAAAIGTVSKPGFKGRAGKINCALYVSGEESVEQIRIRARRLEINSPVLELLTETDVDAVTQLIEKQQYSLVIIDSIQTMETAELRSAAGTISQIKESAARLMETTKVKGTPLILAGHITKEGAIAGPKILEHMVDTVLTLEGERYQNLRLLRTSKNRFGAVDELGVFEMTNKGMVEVKNPSSIFLDEDLLGKPGSAVACVLEGSRPMLVEVEALVAPSNLVSPRRVGQGIAGSRVSLLAAVLQKQAGLRLGNSDIFVKIAGGLRVAEPAIDLAVALAIASSWKEKPLPAKTAAVGEVGLLGEIRQVPRFDLRAREAKRLGFETILSSKDKNLKEIMKKYIS